MAAQFKLSAVSSAGVMSSNPAEVMDLCLYFSLACCPVGRGRCPALGTLRNV